MSKSVTVSQIMPSGGWRIEWTDEDTLDEELVGWGVTMEGEVIPLIEDGDGNVVDAITFWEACSPMLVAPRKEKDILIRGTANPADMDG